MMTKNKNTFAGIVFLTGNRLSAFTVTVRFTGCKNPPKPNTIVFSGSSSPAPKLAKVPVLNPSGGKRMIQLSNEIDQ